MLPMHGILWGIIVVVIIGIFVVALSRT